jgi:hypothetical protein
MWEKLFNLLTNIFTFSSKVDRLEKEIEKLQQENRILLEQVNQPSAEIKVLVYALQSENDKTRMWVEKEMAKFERRLPSGKETDDKKT